YPNKPVRIVVPASPGGGIDISARLIAPKFTELLGQQVIVENRTGWGTVTGMDYVARSAPDGYTLLMGVSSIAINPYIQKNIPYDAVKDFAPISLVVIVPNILISNPKLPAASVKELIAYAKARPGQLNYATGGFGGNQHLGMELFLHANGLKMTTVLYKGIGPAVVDVVAGHVPLMMANVMSALPHIKSGRLRAYGVTGLKRVSVAPDIPTLDEVGVPGFEVVQWFGLLGPARMPNEVIAKLHAATVRALQDPVIRERFANDGGEPVGNTPEEFAAVIRDDLKKWAKVTKDAGIEPK
ncbi:MAG: tripartite tricarboxylate transporter substrate binding protein, partial [Betaproteobacteria bacterium]|nr:tripartite tricarboxylate transporter substrate binding protein [Betaproteobacteria bacterium]